MRLEIKRKQASILNSAKRAALFFLVLAGGAFGVASFALAGEEAPPKEEKQLEEVRPRLRDSAWAWPKEPMNSKTQKVVEAWAEAYRKTETLQYTETITYLDPSGADKPLRIVIRFWGKRPNLARVEVSVAGENESAVMACDGSMIWEYDRNRNLYMKTTQPKGHLMVQGELGVLTHVVGPSLLFHADPYVSLTRGATSLEVVRSEKSKEIVVRRKQPGRATLTWLDGEDYLPRRYSVFQQAEGELREVVREKRADVKVNEAIPNSFFSFKLPAGAKLYSPPRPETFLLKPGTELPDVAWLALNGESVRLSKWRGKAFLLTFWAEWLPNSVKHINSLAKLLQEVHGDENDFAAIAVNAWDETDALSRYRKEHEDTGLSLLRDPVMSPEHSSVYRLLGVRGLPATYLVGKDGKVLKAWIGHDPERMKQIREAVDALLASQ